MPGPAITQRRLSLAHGSRDLDGTAGGRGEAWYVVSGTGRLDVDAREPIVLAPGTAVWLNHGLAWSVSGGSPGGDGLEIVAITVRGEPTADGAPADPAPAYQVPAGPAVRVVRLADCVPERTGDREFRVLLSEGLMITMFVGLIPPGRAPEHHHTYDEVVRVLAGHGIAHLSGSDLEIGPGSVVHLRPYQPHCLENTGPVTLQVLGVFHPAGSPAAKA
jgi:mannose-6-phosphate isomerase-like protein (cupin superfamily)